MLDIVTKANVKRQLGDCARLWSHVRRFRLFGSDNKYGPVVANQLVGDTNTDGTPTETVANPQPKAGDSTKPLKRKRKNSAKKKKGTKKNDPYAKYRTASGAIDMDKLSEENPELYQKMMAEEEAAYKYVDRYGVAHTSEASRDEANAMVVGTPMSDKGVDAMQGFLNAMAEKQEREQREIAQKALNNSLTGQVYNSGNSVPTAVTDAFKINVPSVPDTRVSPLDIIPTKDR